jgi:DNA-binding NarL/FixJ family response regulator
MINILLGEDHKILREGIKSLLKDEPGISVVAEASNGQEAIEKLSDGKANLAILDINMPIMDGLEATRFISENYANTKVIILSMLDHEKYLLKGFEAGAKGYILKNSGREELLFAIKKIMNGEFYICSEIAYTLMDRIKENIGPALSDNQYKIELSDREMEVLGYIAEGLTNNEIADKTFTSRRTVETHRKNLIEKTKTKNTASLIKYAITSKLIK